MLYHNATTVRLYQARQDTVQTPGGSDWVVVARAGRDGLSQPSAANFIHAKNTQSLTSSRVTASRSLPTATVLHLSGVGGD
jgi:hypothetical protein